MQYQCEYTDGSKFEDKNEIGIFIEISKEILSLNIEQNMSIKSLEILPILIAINIVAKFKNIKRIIILSNSKSAIDSLQNTTYYTKPQIL